ncbi:MAG: tRNA (adenosine(37)-N6)-threonylcarbamoyltransferase complex dimerization subunit type 1 TsaB, partial [Bdellovibrionales bacterium]|nr:tRNA (adenosine(37)-N6)-threonylcarbamoyltransferase complex dimerization subunit type 1 TsaB [Bdellovibrionales bacterium]
MLLAFDTSDRVLSVAIATHQRTASLDSPDGAPAGEWLLGGIHQLLASESLAIEDITSIAIALGPGSYTGIRAGISAAQGLAFQSRIELFGVSVLRARALHGVTGSASLLAYIRASQRDYFAERLEEVRT